MFDLTKFGDEAPKYADLLAQGLSIIARVTGNATADKAADILTIVKVVVTSLQHVFEGKIDPSTIEDEFKKFTHGLDANDARADEALRARFGSPHAAVLKPGEK